MKRIMSALLGMSLLTGTLALAQGKDEKEKGANKSRAKAKGKSKGKSTDNGKTASTASKVKSTKKMTTSSN